MGIRELEINHSYTGKGKIILKTFLIPLLEESSSYDRVTSFYTVESLLAISQGIQALFERHGKMRLIIGIHSFPPELVDASLRKRFLDGQINRLRKELQEGIFSISDALEKKRLITLAWMIQDGLLDVKAASVNGCGIFHPKTLIFSDDNDNKVVAIGSPNETKSGLGDNLEQIVVLKSWETPDAVADQEAFFNNLWEGKVEDTTVLDISEETATVIREAFSKEYNDLPCKNTQKESADKILEISARMPANFFVSGDIPALYMHQERAVIDALSRWPVRVLFADEVGLGKTFESAATISFLIKYCGVGRVLILTPKAVLQQWQDELHENFSIEAWLYDSATKVYRDPNQKVIKIGNDHPIGEKAPRIMLMSAQFARGAAGRKDIFSKDEAILPDLLVVDEAHSARVSKDITGSSKKTHMFRMLESVARRIPHMIFATATPMQKDAEEYHAMLKLLGIPKEWQKSQPYNVSLSLIASNDMPDISDAYTAGKLLRSVLLTMRPSLDRFDADKVEVINRLIMIFEDADRFDIGNYVKNNWQVMREAFVRLHPASLLTVRNTRRALSEIGYTFPKRNLKEEPIQNAEPVQIFYNKVNDYISSYCFSIERELDSTKTINLGFIKSNYQQRVASSLYSCKKSLSYRLDKAMDMRNILKMKAAVPDSIKDEFDIAKSLDDMENDELLISGISEYEGIFKQVKELDIKALMRAVELECTSLCPLIHDINELIDNFGDLKIARSIELALKHLEKGDKVLLFSRYTDTIDALIKEFKEKTADERYSYGVYIGQKSIIIKNGKEERCDKEIIKSELFSGSLKIMFCSDAASEGLNLQAARVLINVDVPWTPSKLEQRIGRIARLGQIANEVDIYNVWYPKSIEAKMYHRIQKRLEESNIAIGEFPDVVAEKIKDVVLHDYEQEDESLAQLREIRNSNQTRALKKLWSINSERTTTSESMRKKLMELCRKSFECVGTTLNDKIETFLMHDGTTEALTDMDGMTESISLKSKPLQFVEFDFKNLYFIMDREKNPAAFVFKDDPSRWINHEIIPDILLDTQLSKDRFKEEWPKMLPCNEALNLAFAVDCYLKDRPCFWPPDKKENI